jgi:radical SAM superfamily enzyme YgiQ (UPF0313 family)
MIGETRDDIKATIKYAYKLRQLGADRFYFSYATPLYGTELYEQAKRGGFLKSTFSDEALSEVKPLIETPEFTCDDLLMLSAEANLVNPTFTRDRLARAIRSPTKAIRNLFEREKLIWKKKSKNK